MVTKMYYDKKLQDWIVTQGVIPGKQRWYEIGLTRIKELFACWLKNDIRCMLVTRDYVFNPNHQNYKEVAPFEVEFKGYNKGGKSIIKKTATDSKLDGADMRWRGTFKNKGAIIYDKSKGGELICYLDYMYEASVINGNFNIQWSEKGILFTEDTIYGDIDYIFLQDGSGQ